MTIDIKGTFEAPTADEWDNLLGLPDFELMRIPEASFVSLKDHIFLYPRLEELIKGHNNKVGNIEITYVLCKHYYDKGIPDDRWYTSPGSNGESVQYDPDFSTEHFMRRYWFNHFASTIYIKLFSLWDDTIELVNMYYGLDNPVDLRLRSSVIKWLKDNKQPVFALFDSVKDEPLYIEANKYRTAFVHGIAPSEVSGCYSLQKDTKTTIPFVDENKHITYREVEHATVLSATVGDYTPTSIVLKNIEEFTKYTGNKIQELVSLFLAEI